VLGAGTALDQLSKRWAETQLSPRGIVTLVPELLDLRYVRNPGVFFSLGAGLNAELRRTLFVLASLGVLGLIAAMYRRASQSQVRLRWALSLLAGGAAGNLIDRARHGDVVDFVHLHVGPVLDWAIFNFADVLITAGLLLLALDAFSPRLEARPTASVARTNGGY
jgi:signal peptidase II